MAFPTLFPDGKGDPTNNAIILDTGKSSTEAFANKRKPLMTNGFIDLLHILDLLIGHLIFYIEKGFWVKEVSS